MVLGIMEVHYTSNDILKHYSISFHLKLLFMHFFTISLNLLIKRIFFS